MTSCFIYGRIDAKNSKNIISVKKREIKRKSERKRKMEDRKKSFCLILLLNRIKFPCSFLPCWCWQKGDPIFKCLDNKIKEEENNGNNNKKSHDYGRNRNIRKRIYSLDKRKMCAFYYWSTSTDLISHS